MKEVNVYGSKRHAIVDDEDFEFVSQFDWYLQKGCAWTLIDGEPVEMGYLILHRWVAIKPGNN
jgi:hypothetical protein